MIKSESNKKFNRVESTLSFQGTANFLDLDQEIFFMYQENLRAWIIIEYAYFWSPLNIFWDFLWDYVSYVATNVTSNWCIMCRGNTAGATIRGNKQSK